MFSGLEGIVCDLSHLPLVERAWGQFERLVLMVLSYLHETAGYCHSQYLLGFVFQGLLAVRKSSDFI